MDGGGEKLLVHRLESLSDGSLKPIELLALFRTQAELQAFPDQFGAAPVELTPRLLLRNLSQGAAEEVARDLLGREVSRGGLPSQLRGQRLIERNGEIHGAGPLPCWRALVYSRRSRSGVPRLAMPAPQR